LSTQADAVLALPELPAFPQLTQLPEMVARLWEFPEVKGIWLGGSFAAGTADQFSDVDLRCVVDHGAVEDWKARDLRSIFGEVYIDGQIHDFTGNGVLHHFVGPQSTVYDLWILDYEKDLPGDNVILLACRDEALAARIDAIKPIVVFDPQPASPPVVRRLIVDFWITTSKDIKVVHRGFEAVLLAGLEVQRSYLLRLWYILATGKDPGTSRVTIHLMSRMIPPIRELVGPAAIEILGAPARNMWEIIDSIERNRDEVSRIGRLIAHEVGFDYPSKLEATVREQWEKSTNRMYEAPGIVDVGGFVI